MSEKNMSFEKSLSLDALSSEVGTCEAEIGTLKKIDHTSSATIAVYDRGKSPVPSVELILGTGNPPDGYKKVCEGEAWVLNQKQTLMAIRKEG